MTIQQIHSYEVKESRTGQKIPVLNGIHLHSIYNPFKEAEGLIENFAKEINKTNNFLVMGLGFAYHINELNQSLARKYGQNYKILIVEPHSQVYQDCLHFDLLNRKNTITFAGYNTDELYSDFDFLNFLLKKPAVLAHPASYNFSLDYFQNMLNFKAPTSIGESTKLISHPKVKSYLLSQNAEMSIKELATSLNSKKNLNQLDFMTLALHSMAQKSVLMNKALEHEV